MGRVANSYLVCTAIVPAAIAKAPASADAAPTVATRPATALGQTAMTVNGTIHPHPSRTTYPFEYGPTE